MVLMMLPRCTTLCHVSGGTGFAPCLLPSNRSSLLPHHALVLMPTPMGGSSKLSSTLMLGVTTILDAHLPVTSMGGLRPHIPCSPVMGGITFLLGTSLLLSMVVVHFPLALVSFPMHLHRLPRATVFQACCCALLWCMRNFDHSPVWMPPDLSLALGTDHLLPL
jgi:hypothetical protein